MIRQALEYDLRPDPCRRCREHRRSGQRERAVSLTAALSFWLCGLSVVLLEGTLALAVTAGLAAGAAAAGLTVVLQHRLDARCVQMCGGCR